MHEMSLAEGVLQVIEEAARAQSKAKGAVTWKACRDLTSWTACAATPSASTPGW